MEYTEILIFFLLKKLSVYFLVSSSIDYSYTFEAFVFDAMFS